MVLVPKQTHLSECALLNPTDLGTCTCWVLRSTTFTTDFLMEQLEEAFVCKRFQRLNSFERAVSQGAQMQQTTPYYFITPKTPANTQKSANLVTFWTLEPKTRRGQLIVS